MPVLKIIQKVNILPTATGLPKYHDNNALGDVISYCLDPGKTEKQYAGGFAVNCQQAALEMDLLAHAYGSDTGLRLRHWILSFSSQEISALRRSGWKVYETLTRIAWQAASYYGCQYQIVFAVHKSRKNPHIHFVMNTVNYVTGRKYPGDYNDYYQYRAHLSSILEPYGMLLEVVPDR